MTDWAIDHGDVRIAQGDAREVLAGFPDESVHCIVTSPPFFQLRNYGVDGQIGLEQTPEEWVDALVGVFRECRRVLRSDGTFWLEIGDTYAGGGGGNYGSGKEAAYGAPHLTNVRNRPEWLSSAKLKPKDLIGAPWMVAFALRADGWWLRAEDIWYKPNAMTESVTDRPARAHSQVFLLTKSPSYFFDEDAERTEYKRDGRKITTVKAGPGSGQHRDGERWPGAGANVRTVWTIPTENTDFEHHAVMAQEVARMCISMGTSEEGCCVECGAPWDRVVETEGESGAQRLAKASKEREGVFPDGAGVVANNGKGFSLQHTGQALTPKGGKPRRTIAWAPSCGCLTLETRPCTVLDPFMGAATTALVARRLGRHAVGVELSPASIEISADRLKQMSMLT